MKYDFKGKRDNLNASILDFVFLLDTIKDNSIWLYNGLKVEIDPTIDFTFNNVLIRWKDIKEGFNDRKIYYSLHDFKKDFTLIYA